MQFNPITEISPVGFHNQSNNGIIIFVKFGKIFPGRMKDSHIMIKSHRPSKPWYRKSTATGGADKESSGEMAVSPQMIKDIQG